MSNAWKGRGMVTYKLTDRGEEAVFILLAFLRYGIRHHAGGER